MSGSTLAPSLLSCAVDDLLRPGVPEKHMRQQSEPVTAIATPFPRWNRHCRDEGGGVGLALGWHETIGATTGSGKSLLALNIAAKAIEQGVSVGFLSLEMSKAQVSTRLYAILTGVPVAELERGSGYSSKTGTKASRLVDEIRERTGAKFHMNTEPISGIQQVQSLARYFVEMHGSKMLIVDYLQLLGAAEARTLFDQVTNASAAIRQVAQELKVVSIGLSQFNRPTSTERTSSPLIQGLMGGGPIENDSDQVLLLDHSREQREGHYKKTWAVLGKNRHGSTGEIPIEWDYRTLRVREARPDEEESWP